MSGLLIDGRIVPVPGVTVIGPHDAAWAHLSPGDYRRRRPVGRAKEARPQQWMLHKTIADDPEHLVPGKGPAGGARRTAEYWQQKKPDGTELEYSGAHLVGGHEGELACLADLFRDATYNATVSNDLCVGYETCELVGGRFFEAAAYTTVTATLVGCSALGIQLQCPKRPYLGHPLRRMLDGLGGKTLVGIFGHRNNTERRGRWDPGDILFEMLRARGVESFDFDAGEDITVWKGRQLELNRRGHNLVVDGIPGPATTNALRLEGYRDGIYALGR